MKSAPSFLFVARRELFSFWSIFWIISIGNLYLIFTVFLLNYRLVLAKTDSFPLLAKVTILFSLLTGLFTAFSPVDTIIILLSSVFVGINILLITKTLYILEHAGKMRLSIGGATLIGILSAGCSSCGFSALSVIGLSTSLSFLPFHGLELYLLSFFFFFFSII